MKHFYLKLQLDAKSRLGVWSQTLKERSSGQENNGPWWAARPRELVQEFQSCRRDFGSAVLVVINEPYGTDA